MTFERKIHRRHITLSEHRELDYFAMVSKPTLYWSADIHGATVSGGEVIAASATGPTPAAAVAELEAKLARYGITVIT